MSRLRNAIKRVLSKFGAKKPDSATVHAPVARPLNVPALTREGIVRGVVVGIVSYFVRQALRLIFG